MENLVHYQEYERITSVEELGIDITIDDDHRYCLCGELLNICKDAYSHMSSGV